MVDNATFIPAFIAGWIQLVVPGDCFDEFFVKFNFFDVPCLKMTIIKLLGYAIVVGSSIVKLPQVIKIFKAKSGEGISLLGMTLELLAISTSWAYCVGYEFPFSSYGESVFLAIQTSLIAAMVLAFSGKSAHALAFMSIYVGLMAFGLSPAAPKELLKTLQAGNILLVLCSKMIQVTANFRNGSTGQLSVITQFLLFVGALIRVLTTISETGDMMVLTSYLISGVLNGVILAQIFYYWKSASQSPEDTKAEGKKVK